jgi:hypothetical protein
MPKYRMIKCNEVERLRKEAVVVFLKGIAHHTRTHSRRIARPTLIPCFGMPKESVCVHVQFSASLACRPGFAWRGVA